MMIGDIQNLNEIKCLYPKIIIIDSYKHFT